MAHNARRLPWASLSSQCEPKLVRVSNAGDGTPSDIKIGFKLTELIDENDDESVSEEYDSEESDFEPNNNPGFPHRHRLRAASPFTTRLQQLALEDGEKLMQRLSRRWAPAGPDDIIISDGVARRITPPLLRYRKTRWYKYVEVRGTAPKPGEEIPLCTHETTKELDCGCILPLYFRRYSAFCCLFNAECAKNGCPMWENDQPREFSRAIVMVLLSYNEPEPIVRALVSSKDPTSPGHERTFNCDTRARGFDKHIVRNALHPYLILNTIYLLRQVWDPSCKRHAWWHDYRDTALYQNLLMNITGTKGHARRSDSDKPQISRYPHQDFFEMPPGWESASFTHMNLPGHWQRSRSLWANHPRLGTMPFKSLAGNLEARRRHLGVPVSEFSPPAAAEFLRDKGLPTEVVNDIISMAEEGRYFFPIPDNPLNPLNKRFIHLYLDNCWNTIVLCGLVFGEDTFNQLVLEGVNIEN